MRTSTMDGNIALCCNDRNVFSCGREEKTVRFQIRRASNTCFIKRCTSIDRNTYDAVLCANQPVQSALALRIYNVSAHSFTCTMCEKTHEAR
jgi:hypothetical protein